MSKIERYHKLSKVMGNAGYVKIGELTIAIEEKHQKEK